MSKLKIKPFRIPAKTKYLLGTFVQFAGIFVLSYVFEKILEILIIIPLFFIFRSKYTKTFHANTMFQCSVYTLIMFIILCLLSLPICYSILSAVILCYATTNVLYYIRDYLDIKRIKCTKISVGMNKEKLLQVCKLYNLNELETQVLTLYYCDRLKRWQIGNKLNYSEDNISKIKKKALDKLV